MSSVVFLEDLLSVKLLPLELLKPTENHNYFKVEALEKDILNLGIWKVPLLIEQNNLIIMDGHHRFEVAKRIGLARIPCVVINYNNPYLSLSSKIDSVKITPNKIIEAGLTRNLLPYKSTMHTITLDLLEIQIPIKLLQ